MAGVDYEWLIAQLALRHKIKIYQSYTGWWAIADLPDNDMGPYHCEETAVLKACERYGIDVNEQMDDEVRSEPVRSLFDPFDDNSSELALIRLHDELSQIDGQPDGDMDCNGDVCSF